MDVSEFMNVYLKNDTDADYDIKYDFNEDKEIQGLDVSYMMYEYLTSIKIE